MKRLVPVLLIVILLSLFTSSIYSQSKKYKKNYEQILERTEWWKQSRFGMFIHYGAYSVPARGEWVKSRENMTTEAYQKHVNAWTPTNYNPKEWAKLAKNAGMKYAVMTAKHHDGFCLFDSKFTEYKVSTTNNGRDFVREYLEAFRAEGLKVGLYYSVIDWHHKDYPNVGNHPMRDNKEWDDKPYNWDNYLNYMHSQIEELVTEYGQLDILWMDYSFDDYSGEKWGASKLVKMIREHQPHIILNNRLTQNHGVSGKAREFTGYGDFETPEQGIPEKDMLDKYGNHIPWETCLTLNNSWGFNAFDHDWKSAEQVIHALVECVSKNGNLLLNVGPDSQGNIPKPSVDILKTVGEWMAQNGESIYNCGHAHRLKPSWGYFTQKENVLFAHWTNPKIGHINLKALDPDNVKEVIVLNTNKPAATGATWWGNQDKGNYFINIKDPTYKTYILPDDKNTVFKIIFK